MRTHRLRAISALLSAALMLLVMSGAAALPNEQHTADMQFLVYEARGHAIPVSDAQAAAETWSGTQAPVFLRGGQELEGTTPLATGDEVRFAPDSAASQMYRVVVRGDLAGTGRPGITQLTALAAALKAPKDLNAVQRCAADIDGSGAVGLADLVRAAKYLGHPDPEGPLFAAGTQELAAYSDTDPPQTSASGTFSADDIPAYHGEPWTAVHGNVPYFDVANYAPDAWESYSALDDLGRCGEAFACVGLDVMPSATRAPISTVRPTGWQSVKYPDVVPGGYLYNRCHLIGFQLTAEDANELNLITGTRALNIEGMLPFENMVADYVQETRNHVLYRVTPVFVGQDLVVRGVLMEAASVEDCGEDIEFCVFAYNVQPGVVIDYGTGESSLDSSTAPAAADPSAQPSSPPSAPVLSYVLNTSTHKFHLSDCSTVKRMKPESRQDFTGTRSEVLEAGYDPCGICKP